MLKGKGEWYLKLETVNHEGHANQINYNKSYFQKLLDRPEQRLETQLNQSIIHLTMRCFRHMQNGGKTMHGQISR